MQQLIESKHGDRKKTWRMACLIRRRPRHWRAQRGSDEGGNPRNGAGLRSNFNVTGA
jgi:hypothetical protein